MFTEYMLAHWAGFDFARPLEERREALQQAIRLRKELGIGPTSVKQRLDAPRRADPLAEELERVERQLGVEPRRRKPKPKSPRFSDAASI